MSHGPRIVIVGGGISGLVAAYRLEQFLAGAEVTVLESEPRVGGKVCTNDRDGFRIERGPNGFLDNKPHLLNLCENLGLAERLLPASDTSARNRFLFLHNQLHKLPTSFWSFLRSKTLSLPGKINLLFERVRPRRYDTADESIEAFVRRRTGEKSRKRSPTLSSPVFSPVIRHNSAFKPVFPDWSHWSAIMEA